MTRSLAIVDYGVGNLRSAQKAFETLGQPAEITIDADRIAAAPAVVLPGQGAFGTCMENLAAAGLVEPVRQAARSGRPFLGICVGMQLMAERGLEFEVVKGFGWIAGDVVPIEPEDPTLKIPHMGWNELTPRGDHPVLAGLPAGTHVYFVHGFELYPSDRANVLAETDYGGPIVAAVGRDNLIGTQFHPDKSQQAGLRFIANFLRWRP